MLKKIDKLINEINKVHLTFFQDYFETNKIEKINLKHTLPNAPVQHILAYRLNLYEFINDYLHHIKILNLL